MSGNLNIYYSFTTFLGSQSHPKVDAFGTKKSTIAVSWYHVTHIAANQAIRSTRMVTQGAKLTHPRSQAVTHRPQD